MINIQLFKPSFGISLFRSAFQAVVAMLGMFLVSYIMPNTSITMMQLGITVFILHLTQVSITPILHTVQSRVAACVCKSLFSTIVVMMLIYMLGQASTLSFVLKYGLGFFALYTAGLLISEFYRKTNKKRCCAH